MRAWWSRLCMMLNGRRRLPEDLREEIEAHLEMDIQENVARGMPEEEARRAARRGFGNTARIQEDAKDAWGFTAIETLIRDLGYAGRMALKSPGFATIAVLTLALGIAGTTTMFTVIRTMLLKPLDYPDPGRLLDVLVSGARQGQPDLGFNLIRYREMQNASSLSALAASGIPETVTISSGSGEPVPVREARVSANFLDVLRVSPSLGRSFLADEDRSGGPAVAMISDGLWRRRFDANPNIVGSSISLDARDYTVVGVLPPNFEYPSAGYDIWVTRPWEWSEVAPGSWEQTKVLRGVARLKPGASLEQARLQLNLISRQYALAHPGLADADPKGTMRVERLQDRLVQNYRDLLWMLFAAASFVLLIVCANLASLLLARSAARLREFAVRSSLGAGRRRLMQQMLVESVCVAVIGGLLSVPLASGILAVMMRIARLDMPRAYDIHVDGAVLAFTAAVSMLTGILFGLLPARRISGANLSDFLREQGGAFDRPVLRLGTPRFLVIGQVGLSVVLLVGASLMLQSFFRVRNVNPGFEAAHLLTMEIALPPVRYDTNQTKQTFWDELVERVGALPGVVNVAVARSLPTTITDGVIIQIAEQPRQDVTRRPRADAQAVTPKYFSTLGIPLIQGREFSARDREGASRVTVINETLARRFWPGYPRGQSPIGQHILVGGKDTSLEVVGIVADVHEDGLASDIQPEIYYPAAQGPPQTAFLAVKTAGDPHNLVSAIREQVTATDPNESVTRIQTMTELLSATFAGPLSNVIMLSSFAVVAFAVTMIGIYGVIAFLVVQRTQEFGIRQALGARRGQILKLAVGRGVRLMLIGLAMGNLAAAGVTRLMRGMLFHVSAGDAGIFALISAMFLAVGLAASYLPARKAMRVDPAAILR